MQLYYMPGACSMASHIVALETDRELDLVKVDGATKQTETGEDFRQINPNGYVPAIKLDDGQVLTENVAILNWLADGDMALPLDALENARVLEVLSFLNAELHKAYSPFFSAAPLSESEKAKAFEKLETRLDHIDRLLADGSDYLTGDAFTIADAYGFVILNWSNPIGHSLANRPAIMAFQQRVASRPAVQKAMEREGLLEKAL